MRATFVDRSAFDACTGRRQTTYNGAQLTAKAKDRDTTELAVHTLRRQRHHDATIHAVTVRTMVLKTVVAPRRTVTVAGAGLKVEIARALDVDGVALVGWAAGCVGVD